MICYLFIRIVLVLQIAMLVVGYNFWTSSRQCGKIKEALEQNQAINKSSDVFDCIFDCFGQTTRYSSITTNDCFVVLVKPYIEKVLKKEIPSNEEMQTCLNAKDRSNCKDTLLYVFTKWLKDQHVNKRPSYFIFMVISHIPDIRRKVGYGYWDFEIGKDLSKLKFDSENNIQQAIKRTSNYDLTQFPLIYNELKRYCYRKINDDNQRKFCTLRVIMAIVRKIQDLASGKSNYGQNFQKYVEAVKSNFVAFSVLFRESHSTAIEPTTVEGKLSLLDSQLDTLVDLLKSGDTHLIQEFLQFMPETYILDKACQQTFLPILTERCCILERVVEQLLIYSEMAEKRKKNVSLKTVLINFSLNLRSIITELRGEEVFKLLVENRYETISNTEETANLIEGKFGQLKAYFSKLQSYNMQKARADVSYIKGRIDYYREKTQRAINTLSEHVGKVLWAAIGITGADVAEKALKLTFAIAEACNPLKTVFNGGTASDILDATGELSKAIAGIVEAIALKNAWSGVIEEAVKIKEGFQNNAEFLSAAGRIVENIKLSAFPDDDDFEENKSHFLTLYEKYTPQVDKEMLAALASKFDTLVDSACELIDGADGTVSNAIVAYVKDHLYCPKSKERVSRLQAIYEEIYDFQFEFVESMAEYLRSSTGYHASQKMASLTGKTITVADVSPARTSQLRAHKIMAHITYEMQKQSAVQSLCDFLEYKEGGETPDACKESTIDLPTLLSYIPRRCKAVNIYVSIPLTTSSKTIPGHLNVKELYSGNDVSFQIPSYDWMKQHKWIREDDDFQAIYIRSFEVFLPTITDRERKIDVTVRSMGGNRFQSNGKEYSLVPTESFDTVYTGAQGFSPCSGIEIENPYSICEDRKLPKVCAMSDILTFDEEKRLYPSVFSKFIIKAKGVTTAQKPNPRTPLDVKAKINMCMFKDGQILDRRSVVDQKLRCCGEDSYWNESESKCKPCPDGSTPNLNGYYCEKDKTPELHKKRKGARHIM